MNSSEMLALVISIFVVLFLVFFISRGFRSLKRNSETKKNSKSHKYDRHHRSAWSVLNEGEDPTL